MLVTLSTDAGTRAVDAVNRRCDPQRVYIHTGFAVSGCVPLLLPLLLCVRVRLITTRNNSRCNNNHHGNNNNNRNNRNNNSLVLRLQRAEGAL
jgi:hypothetical protein